METEDLFDDVNQLSPASQSRKKKVSSEWTTDLCLSLCNEVESRPELWDASNKSYHDRNSIRLAWNEIASVFLGKYSSEECSRKWQSLRASHRRELSKLRTKISKSGLGAVEPPTWPFFTAMKFLTSTNSTIAQSNLIFNLDEGSLDNSLEERSIDNDVEALDPLSMDTGEAKRRKITFSNSSAASTSQTDLQARIDEGRSEIALPRCVHNDEDRILSNFVFSSLKTMKPEAAAKLRQQLKSLILKEMVTEIETIKTPSTQPKIPIQKVQDYKGSLIKKAEELIITGFPEKIVKLNDILATPLFADRDFSDVHQDLNIPVPDPIGFNHDDSGDFGPPTKKRARVESCAVTGAKIMSLPSGTVKCNTPICELITVVKPVIRSLVEDSNLLKMWISFMIPKIEDGNNFGVSIQEDTLAEIQSVESESAAFFDQISRYFISRAKCVSKVAKYPHIDDYRRSVQELDEKEFLSLWLVMSEVRNRYCSLHDIVIKNLEKLKKPRSSNAENLY